MRKRILSLGLMLVTSSLFASELVTFTAGTPAKASEVNNNFQVLLQKIESLETQLQNCNCSTTPIINETFETYSLGTPIAPWKFQSSWGDSGVIKIVDSPVANGTKSIKVKGLSGWTQGIYLENSLQFTDVIMSFSINIPSGNSKGKAPGSIGYGGIYISFYANSNGSYDARFNHDENIAIKNITAGSWHTLSLKVNWDKSQGELIYGSNTTGVFNFTKNDSAGWNSDISLNGNNSSETNTIYVDDIKLSKTTIE